ncbi:MAG: geranylgeranylglycerol-phosphate geranylgeranyltransferase [Flavobacteriales bacterium]
MAPFSNLLRLTRPGNLLIVAVTMLVVRFFVVGSEIQRSAIGMDFGINGFDFFLQILVAVMLTAAGNIINDYFDQKVDRINKPGKVIIGKLVKRRVAIILHQLLNIGAVLISLYLCIRTDFWWPMLIPVLIATLLWWYSPYLKKKVWIGNAAIALCTSAVPIWAGVFELHQLRKNYLDMLVRGEAFFEWLYILIYALAVFAFILTLIREAQKDMEDLPGDTEGGYQTMPIKMGIGFTKRYVFVLLGFYIVSALYFLLQLYKVPGLNAVVFVVVAILLLAPSALSFWATLRAETPAHFHKASFYTKCMMIAGLISFCILSYLMV